MKTITFEEYLSEIFMTTNPQVLDDDLPDAFDNWLVDLQIDDVIKYAEAWGETLLKKLNQTYDDVMMKR